MIWVTCTFFALLLGVLLWVGRSLLFPPVVFVGTWLASLVTIALLGEELLPVGEKALLVYSAGALALAGGGVLARAVPAYLVPTGRPRLSGDPSVRWALDLVLLVLVAGFPFYWAALTELAGTVEPAQLLFAIRAAEIERADQRTTFNPALNLNLVAQFAAMAMLYESDGTFGRTWRTAVTALLALVYGVASGTKVYAVSMLLALYFVTALRHNRLRLGVLVGSLSAAVVLFSVGLVAVNFVSTQFGDLTTAALGLVRSIQLYWLGGFVAFTVVAENPGEIVSTQPIDRFFLETARSLGLHVEVPPKHADYVNYTTFDETNTFTIYFSYFKDHGWAGTLLLMALLGFGVSLLHRRASRGGALSLLLLARLCVGLVLSIHAEHFLTQLNSLIKFGLFLWLVYCFVPRVAAWRKPLYA